jgi:uncharacterized protein with GYD domain
MSSRGIVLRSKSLSKLLSAFALISLFFTPSGINAAALPIDEAAKLLPDQVGEYRAVSSHRPLNDDREFVASDAISRFNARSTAIRDYRSAKGQQVTLTVTTYRSDSDAYAFLVGVAHSIIRMERNPSAAQKIRTGEVGTASIVFPDRILFFKGPVFVAVNRPSLSSDEEFLAFARLFAESLNKGEGDIPVLVKHLPDWEKAQERALYATTLDVLKSETGNPPILEAVSFEGGAEAVTATYGPSRLVIIENTTPQLATDNDARIQGKIRELREQGQSVPSAYQRVGNYSVLVFDAPDEQTAMQLIKAISYEQTVQWLGDNPRALERAQRQYTETTANIILAVLKASGLSILLCLGIGGLFGGLVFRHRRAQQAASTAYSDAGEMVRLNLDGMTAQNDPARLLGRGDG